MRKTIAQQLAEAQVVIDNALNKPNLRKPMEAYGYDLKRIGKKQQKYSTFDPAVCSVPKGHSRYCCVRSLLTEYYFKNRGALCT